jgi:hypothetical protein
VGAGGETAVSLEVLLRSSRSDVRNDERGA